jgi:hypothetical protein
MFGRIAVMAVCLIVIPLVALFGGSLPGLVQSLIDDYWTGNSWTGGEVAVEQTLEEAPLYRPEVSTSSFSKSSEVASEAPTPASLPTSESNAPSFNNDPSFNRAVAFTEKASPPPFAAEAAESRSIQRADSSGSADSAVIPVGSLPQANPASVEQGADRFSQIQRRLRDLGAVYYRLETWGSKTPGFRFHCRVALGEHKGLSRHFEATDFGALASMEKVLAEVELWHNQRQR